MSDVSCDFFISSGGQNGKIFDYSLSIFWWGELTLSIIFKKSYYKKISE